MGEDRSPWFEGAFGELGAGGVGDSRLKGADDIPSGEKRDLGVRQHTIRRYRKTSGHVTLDFIVFASSTTDFGLSFPQKNTL